MSELHAEYPSGLVRYEIVRSEVQERDLVEKLYLGTFNILMIFKSMSHIPCNSHITNQSTWFCSSNFPIHLPFYQHLCFERKTLILLLLALKTQSQLKRQNPNFNIKLHYLATICFYFTYKLLFIFTGQIQKSTLLFHFPDAPGSINLFFLCIPSELFVYFSLHHSV